MGIVLVPLWRCWRLASGSRDKLVHLRTKHGLANARKVADCVQANGQEQRAPATKRWHPHAILTVPVEEETGAPSPLPPSDHPHRPHWFVSKRVERRRLSIDAGCRRFIRSSRCPELISCSQCCRPRSHTFRCEEDLHRDG